MTIELRRADGTLAHKQMFNLLSSELDVAFGPDCPVIIDSFHVLRGYEIRPKLQWLGADNENGQLPT